MELGLSGKACIVTGASRGIGLDVAMVLAEEGADVALVSRDAAALEAAAVDLRALGVRAFAVPGDMTDPAQVTTAMQAAIAQLGRVDILINNAGGSTVGRLEDLTDEQWLHGFALKPLAYIRAIREVIPAMRQQGHGRIVNVAGAAARWAMVDYAMGCLNAATVHLTKSTAELLAPDGISVVAVNPGVTGPTDRTDTAFRIWAETSGKSPEEVEKAYLAALPLNRMASPREVAKLIVMMASDIAEYTTGSALQIDGAQTSGVF